MSDILDFGFLVSFLEQAIQKTKVPSLADPVERMVGEYSDRSLIVLRPHIIMAKNDKQTFKALQL